MTADARKRLRFTDLNVEVGFRESRAELNQAKMPEATRVICIPTEVLMCSMMASFQ